LTQLRQNEGVKEEPPKNDVQGCIPSLVHTNFIIGAEQKLIESKKKRRKKIKQTKILALNTSSPTLALKNLCSNTMCSKNKKIKKVIHKMNFFSQPISEKSIEKQNAHTPKK